MKQLIVSNVLKLKKSNIMDIFHDLQVIFYIKNKQTVKNIDINVNNKILKLSQKYYFK